MSMGWIILVRARTGFGKALRGLALALVLIMFGATAAVAAPVDPDSALRGMVVSERAAEAPSRGGASLAPTGSGALSGAVIVVDPGHNGRYRKTVNTRLVPAGNGKKACNSSGTSTSTGSFEHSFAWQVGVRLAGELRTRGATVVLTRPDDAGTGPCVDERAAIGNRANADLVVSIHADGDDRRDTRGFHLIVSPAMAGGNAAQTASISIAERLRVSIENRTAMPRSNYIGQGTAISVRTDLGGLNLSRGPAVLLEAGNMRNAKDAALLTSTGWQAALAQALADGVQTALRRTNCRHCA